MYTFLLVDNLSSVRAEVHADFSQNLVHGNCSLWPMVVLFCLFTDTEVFLAGPESLVFPAAQLGYLTMQCVRAQKQQM